MQAREGQGLRQVGLTFGAGHRAPGVDLDDDVPVEAGQREPLQQLGAGLGAAAGDQMLVLRGTVSVGEVDVAQAVAHAVDHLHRVRAGRRGVAEVDREVPVVVLGDVPVRRVREHLAVAVTPRVHVLDSEPYVRLARHPPDARDEVPRVLALPAERRMDDDGARAELLGRRAGPLELGPRVGRPHPLRDEQAGGVDGEDRDPVVVAEPAQRVDVLADGVVPDHDLDAVVPEARGDLEGRRRRLRIDRGRRQGDLRIRDPHDGLCHGGQVTGCGRVRAGRLFAVVALATVGCVRFVVARGAHVSIANPCDQVCAG